MAGILGKIGGIGQDPNFANYLNAIAGQNISRMQNTYQNLGLDTSNEAMGMSPQESKDIGWLEQGAQGTGTLGFLANASNVISGINQQTGQAGQTGLNTGLQQGLTGGTQTG